jgi:hypothetical protein
MKRRIGGVCGGDHRIATIPVRSALLGVLPPAWRASRATSASLLSAS